MQELHFKVEGMKCQKNCATKVQQALARLPGVREASVDFPTRMATVRGAPSALTMARVCECVQSTGNFSVVEEESQGRVQSEDRAPVIGSFEVPVEGMKCERSCARNLEWALEELPGVESVQVLFSQKKVQVVGQVSLPDIVDIIQREGFSVPSAGECPSAPKQAPFASSNPSHGGRRGGQQGFVDVDGQTGENVLRACVLLEKGADADAGRYHLVVLSVQWPPVRSVPCWHGG